MDIVINAGMIGGIIGSIVGLVGGVIGTWCSIQNTTGPRERRFMIKASMVAWLALTLFLACLLLLPSPYRWFAWIPYGIFLPLGINAINRNQQRIRQEEHEAQ